MPIDEEPIPVLRPLHPQWMGSGAAFSGILVVAGFFLPLVNFLAYMAVGFAGLIGLAGIGHFSPGNSALVRPLCLACGVLCLERN